MFEKLNLKTTLQKNLIKLNTSFLSKKSFLKHRIKGIKNSSGRNHSGKITSFNKGGGHKKNYRNVNFNRTKNFKGIVTSLEYDPFRSSFIASVFDFFNKVFFYILAPKGLKIGDIVETGINAELKLGNALPLYKISVGSFIHNVSTLLNKKASISRAAGTYSILLEKIDDYGKIKISSKKIIFIKLNSYATLGSVSNENFWVTTIGKAGRSRWLNRRPKVRGVAMNPVDHPHGGGEGKKSGVKALSPWGKITKNGKKTSTTLKK